MSLVRGVVNRLGEGRKAALKDLIFKARNVYVAWRRRGASPAAFRRFLREDFGVREGDSLLVHASMDRLAVWGLTAYEVLNHLREAVGDRGTLVMPTFPTRDSEAYLANYRPFNVRRAPSQMGLLSEVFRRLPEARRSLDPIRPFSALGPKADDYCADHHRSIYSYDEKSPLYKVAMDNGKMIGLGVPVHNFTFVHTIENLMGADFPVPIYDERIFELEVIDAGRRRLTVRKKIVRNELTRYRNIEKYARHFDRQVLRRFSRDFSPYFYCDALPFLEAGRELARRGITIYPRGLLD